MWSAEVFCLLCLQVVDIFCGFRIYQLVMNHASLQSFLSVQFSSTRHRDRLNLSFHQIKLQSCDPQFYVLGAPLVRGSNSLFHWASVPDHQQWVCQCLPLLLGMRSSLPVVSGHMTIPGSGGRKHGCYLCYTVSVIDRFPPWTGQKADFLLVLAEDPSLLHRVVSIAIIVVWGERSHLHSCFTEPNPSAQSSRDSFGKY